MKGYGQFCPVAKAAELLTERWTPLVVRERRQRPDGTPEYHLTESGRELLPIVRMMGEWGQRWLRSRLTRDQLDAGLLLWDMHRTIDPRSFPPGRTVVRIELTDEPKSRRCYWLVSEEGQDHVVVWADPLIPVFGLLRFTRQDTTWELVEWGSR